MRGAHPQPARAARVPAPATDADMDLCSRFYSAGRESGWFETGIQKGLLAVLSSTNFLYRGEPGGPPAGVEPGAGYAMSDLELASRLAFFLWSEGPDEELLGLAESGGSAIRKFTRRRSSRMLGDPRAESLVTNFAFQWLSVPQPRHGRSRPEALSELRRGLAAGVRRGDALFLDSILRDQAGASSRCSPRRTRS